MLEHESTSVAHFWRQTWLRDECAQMLALAIRAAYRSPPQWRCGRRKDEFGAYGVDCIDWGRGETNRVD